MQTLKPKLKHNIEYYLWYTRYTFEKVEKNNKAERKK